jgi:uncharacterized protein (TIGR03435 family)
MMLGLLAIGVLTLSAVGQATTSQPSGSSAVIARFQVATIKPSRPDESRTMQYQGNRFATTDTPVVDLPKYAYGLQEQEMFGGPKWLKTQKFDLVGDPETQARPSSEEFKKMVQNLLSDRFHLAAYRESRDLSVYEIVSAKSGPNLNKSTKPPDCLPVVGFSPGWLTVGNATIGDFAGFLQRYVSDRPVFDATGITGKYDLSLRWTPEDSQTEGSRQGDDSNNSFSGFLPPFKNNWG